MSAVAAALQLPADAAPPQDVTVTLGDVMLWGVLPYVVIAVLVLGSIWRYRYDQFGWTTRSSQLYEARILRIASPLFHFGILAVIVGHFIGLVIPKSWTEQVGVSEGLYHAMALGIGIIAGIGTLVGIVLLIYRRRTTGPVFMATTNNDKFMYIVLLGALLAGLATTLISVFDTNVTDYRQTVSPWFRSIFIFQPDIAAMTAASLSFKIHTLWGLALFAIWPFTRLVHAFTAPLQYLFRPYIVYRSRGRRPVPGALPPRRGWAPIGTPDRDRRGVPPQ
ncbi:respiratory nitrate reductase subunit gamma [Arthrobacter sp. Sa2CUA1]|uniref:Respiratory nitrate reductase subunit gamma n=1 Tax=Arthrobacter gallicola TaxID=2762225 RepID=A0ABR8UST6_9MICC|nr:respiratory nitrate reductase subunit gamma [Arthrobacter gallicola]MBD7995636.1 respiratory nitrate reductase subunit gamma [Arthrobacter gallicola]